MFYIKYWQSSPLKWDFLRVIEYIYNSEWLVPLIWQNSEH